MHTSLAGSARQRSAWMAAPGHPTGPRGTVLAASGRGHGGELATPATCDYRDVVAYQVRSSFDCVE